MKRWEYKQVEKCSLNEMNVLGEQGWELIHVQRDNVSGSHWYYFKREKS